MADKIRPNPSPRELRDEGTRDLPDIVRAPDLARGEADPDALNANAGLVPGSTEGWPTTPPGARTFEPAQAAAARATHGEQNRLGKPYVPTESEQVLQAYLAAEKAFKEDYKGSRSLRLEVPYLQAKQRMIELGLMKGDV